MQLSQMIVKIRKEQGLTQETFAKKFNVTRQTVSNWENEKSYPDLHTLVKISDEFHVSLDVLLKGDSAMINEIDKKVKKHRLYKGIIAGLLVIVAVLAFVIYSNDRSIGGTVQDYMDNYVKGIKTAEVYDSSGKDLLVKYDDENAVQEFVSLLNIGSWEKSKIKEGAKPEYIIKLYDDIAKQKEDDDMKEITIYENGEYAAIFVTYPGGVKQEYKTDIDVSELIRKMN